MSAGLAALLLLLVSNLGYHFVRSKIYNQYQLNELPPQEVGLIYFTEGLKVILLTGIFLWLLYIGLKFFIDANYIDVLKKNFVNEVSNFDIYQRYVPNSWYESISAFHFLIIFYVFCLFLIKIKSVASKHRFNLQPFVVQAVERREYLEKYRTEFEVLVAESILSLHFAEQTEKLSDLMLLLITLETGKVYVGYPIDYDADKKFEYVQLFPVLSGFRDKKSKKVYFTEEYSNLYKAELRGGAELGDGAEFRGEYGEDSEPNQLENSTEEIEEEEVEETEYSDLKLHICIPVSRIVSISTYDMSFAKESIQ